MAAVFKVDALDLSAHLRVNQGDGLDPYGQGGFLDPQFADGALSDGDPLISIREGNREQQWAVILNPAAAGYTASKDGLHQLIRDVNRALKNAQVIEWRDDGATLSTYFDARFARFDPAYDYRRSQKLWVPGVIKAWTRPYGHTGTTRVIGTAAGSVAAAQLSIASGTLAGDADGDVFAIVSLPSPPQDELLVGYSVGPAAGWVPIWPVGSMGVATKIAASGAFASQAARAFCSPGSAQVAVSVTIDNTVVPSGPHRVIALARTTTATAQASAVVVYAELENGVGLRGGLGVTQVLPTGKDWRVIDLGTFDGGTAILPNTLLAIKSTLLSASSGASGSVDLGALLVLPEGRTVAALTTTGMINLNTVATYVFDGMARSVVGADGITSGVGNRYALDNYVRGDFPRLPVGTGCNVVAFALPDNDTQNHPVNVEIRCREKFSFAR